MGPTVHGVFDPQTWTITYVVYDEGTRDAVVIDPVLDFDPLAVRVSRTSIDGVIDFVRRHDLKVHWALETHAHADHMSGAQPLKDALGAKLGIGEPIVRVQATFKKLFDLPASFPTDGRQWDLLIRDGAAFRAGSLEVVPVHTPGHTPACMSYRIGDALFTGDALFMPDFGTGRCDFPGGSAEQLYDSVMKLYALPDATRVFVGHDYQPGGRSVAYETTIGESKRNNVQLRADTPRAEFVAWRSARDKTLRPPNLIFQSLQVNVAAGALPEPNANGVRYLRLPIGVL